MDIVLLVLGSLLVGLLGGSLMLIDPKRPLSRRAQRRLAQQQAAEHTQN